MDLRMRLWQATATATVSFGSRGLPGKGIGEPLTVP